mgnify:FL=1
MKYRLNGKEFDNQKDYRKALKESEERNHSHKPWGNKDDSRLIELSEEDNMTITELSDFFKRTELAIINRLEKLVTTNEIITNDFHSNGLKKQEQFNKNGELRYITNWYENGQKEYEGNYKTVNNPVKGLNNLYMAGLWTEWYENGQKKFQGHYQGGERRNYNPHKGFCTEWYENGQKKYEGEPIGRDGLTTEWYDNGQKKSEKHREDDSNLPLLLIEWHENGQKKSEENFKTKTGKLIEWHENGQKKLEGQYDENLFTDGQFKDIELNKEDFKNGKWTEWHENGNKKIEGSYTFDFDFYRSEGMYAEKVGEWVEWHENSQIKIIIDFTDKPFENHTELKVNCWHANGQKKFEGSFLSKKEETYLIPEQRSTGRYMVSIDELVKDEKWEGQIGLCIEWYENGQKKSEGNYSHFLSSTRTRKEGQWSQWHENGQKKSEGNYDSYEHKEGKWTEWYENGQKKFEGGRKPSRRLDGLCNEWDTNGQKVYERYYENFQDDKLDFRYIEWHDDNQGQRKVKTQYEEYSRLQDLNDVSKKTEWYKNGQKRLERIISNQQVSHGPRHKNSSHKQWYDNGQKMSEGVYEIFSSFDWPNWLDHMEIENDNPGHYEYEWKEPVKKGKWTSWHYNGQKKSEGYYNVGEVRYTGSVKSNKDGLWTEWYNNGQKKSEGSYTLIMDSDTVLASHKYGLWTEWDKDYQIKSSKFIDLPDTSIDEDDGELCDFPFV